MHEADYKFSFDETTKDVYFYFFFVFQELLYFGIAYLLN